MDGSLCQWLQLHGKELGAGEDGEEILGNSFHKGLKCNKGDYGRVKYSQLHT